jgi:C4-dicarboxylate transporter DctQ subunit
LTNTSDSDGTDRLKRTAPPPPPAVGSEGRTLLQRLLTAYVSLIHAMAVLGALILVGMSLWITYDVVARYLFASPTIWANDLSEYGLLWATFLAAPWVLRREGHVRIEIFVERLSRQHRRTIGVIVSLVGAVVCVIFAWQTALTTVDFFTRGLMEARIWRIPQWIPYSVIPLGSAFLAAEFVARVLRYARHTSGDLLGQTGHL